MELDLARLRDIPLHDLLGLKSARRQMIKCPFHAERSGSCMIYPEDNHWYCFGCGSTGQGAIDFLVASGCTVKEAIKELTDYLSSGPS